MTRALLHPAPLGVGDRVSIVAPSGPVPEEALNAGIERIAGMGLEPVFDEGLLTRDGFLAGDDDRRLEELRIAIRARDTVALWAARGGYGATRLLPRLDIGPIRDAGKHLIGFSDITALHAAWQRAGLSSTHAANVTSLGNWGTEAIENLRAALFGGRWSRLQGQGGRGRCAVEGLLVGGNLTVLAAMAGTPYFPSLDGGILLVEDVNEPPYRLDRVLTQLTQARALEGLRGVAVGQLTQCDDRDETPRNPVALDVILEHVERLGVPMVWGLPVGHESNSCAVPLGRHAVVDPANRWLCFPD